MPYFWVKWVETISKKFEGCRSRAVNNWFSSWLNRFVPQVASGCK